ncbi:MAG TPA: TIGR00730 family Rossman fold protein [Candidatus Limnocylindria bacterium]|nr:TIGR00730 family Rossman fold protein [Candidatus Limnocylindria bacterium]
MKKAARSHARSRRPETRVFELLPRILADHGLSQREELAREMVVTALKLLRDNANLGDFKLLNASVRELRYAFNVFQQYRGVRKVSIFGSARTPPTDVHYQTAREFARRITERGFMVITGAGNGIMQAAQEGAGRERSFGVNIRLPFEQEPNPVIRDDPKLVTFRYFFTRKVMFVKEADAVVLFPGGFGTMDEAYESLTLVQTGKSKPMPIVFLDAPRGTYWQTWQRYVHDHLLRRKLISPADLSLFKVTSNIEEAVEEVAGFYRLYHSSRFVNGNFVIRLMRPVDPEHVERWATDFSELLLGEGIQMRGPLDEERQQEPELDALPRLVMRYDPGQPGRLRQLLDRINREG